MLGNERLTGAAGIVLVVLLAALGVTILRVRPLIEPHMFIGLLLIPPVALKLASTGYRFARYYTRSAIYRERGAPHILMRALGPVVVASTVGVFGTGVGLLIAGPDSAGALRFLHKASFVVWVGATSLHVLGHLPDLQKTFLTRRGERLEYNGLAAGSLGRTVSLGGALTAGVVLAILLVPHFAGWSHFEAFRIDH